MADDLLVRYYDGLSMEEQAYAIEEAWRLGWEYARIYGEDHAFPYGKIEPRDYVLYVVEDSYELGVCDKKTYRIWQQASDEKLEADPRVQVFMRAWVEKIMEEE